MERDKNCFSEKMWGVLKTKICETEIWKKNKKIDYLDLT